MNIAFKVISRGYENGFPNRIYKKTFYDHCKYPQCSFYRIIFVVEQNIINMFVLSTLSSLHLYDGFCGVVHNMPDSGSKGRGFKSWA